MYPEPEIPGIQVSAVSYIKRLLPLFPGYCEPNISFVFQAENHQFNPSYVGELSGMLSDTFKKCEISQMLRSSKLPLFHDSSYFKILILPKLATNEYEHLKEWTNALEGKDERKEKKQKMLKELVYTRRDEMKYKYASCKKL